MGERVTGRVGYGDGFRPASQLGSGHSTSDDNDNSGNVFKLPLGAYRLCPGYVAVDLVRQWCDHGNTLGDDARSLQAAATATTQRGIGSYIWTTPVLQFNYFLMISSDSEADLAAGLFAVEDIAEAASLLLPQRPEDLRRLVGLTFCRPPRFMPSCFIRDYIRVMCTENVKEKTELLYALINGRKLSDLPKINQQTLIIWGEQDRVFPLELGLRLKRHLGDTSELVIVKNAGHAINREKPAELCRLIKNYIADPSVKYRDGHKGSWKNTIKRFAGSSLRKVDSTRPLL
uniref:Peptidase S33 tripeptidyl aminopeptidase-like C-terminal domain-containing protein n=1 Tax=Oryza brachyantha TaxID=4533 RepID=J3N266_ORYBR